MLDFTGQTVIVTSAAENRGQAIARWLSRLRASPTLADMQKASLEFSGADVRTREGCDEIAGQALTRFDRIDGLANTVGKFRTRSIAEGTSDD